MKRKIQRFELLLKLAQRKRQEAERLLAQAQQRVQQANSGLEQLEQYRNEYQQQFTAAGRSGFSAARMQHWQAFIHKIGNAQAQQREALQQSQAQLEAVEKHWRQARAHQQAIEKLLDKARREWAAQEEKQLQQQLDERAQHIRPPFI